MRWVTLLMIGWFLAGCEDPPRPQPARVFFERELVSLHANSSRERASAINTMVSACCRARDRHRLLDPTPFEEARSCGEMERLFRTERDPKMIDALFGLWDPGCYRKFPEPTLTGICLSGESCPLELREQVVYILERVDPSIAIVRTIIAHLGQTTLDSKTSDPRVPGPPSRPLSYAETEANMRVERSLDVLDIWAVLALFRFGESELMPVIELTTSHNERMRKAAVEVLAYAVGEMPLELPEALTALELASQDPVPAIAVSARFAAEQYRRHENVPPEVTLAELVAKRVHSSTLEQMVRLLAVRRFSCRTPAARSVLEQLRRHPGRDISVLAAQALALRAQRCATIPARPPSPAPAVDAAPESGG